MSESDRSEILANFQACTGTEDIGIAIAILEQESWDLQRALQSYMDAGPADAQHPADPPREPMCTSPVPMMDQDEDFVNPLSRPNLDVFGQPGSGSGGGGRSRQTAPAAAAAGGTGSSRSGAAAASSGSRSRPARQQPPGGLGLRSNRTAAPAANNSSGAAASRIGSESRSRSGASGAAAAAASASASSSSTAASSGSRSRETRACKQRLLLFKVQLDDDLLHTVDPDLAELNVISKETDTVLDIKRQIHELMEQPIDIDDMRLRGFPTSVSDSTVLETLRLPKETKLWLASANPEISQRVVRPAEYHLTVRNADRTNCSQVFHYSADTSVGQLRSDVYSLWGIPSASQAWSGWDLNWSVTFGQSNLPSHQDLTVKRNPAAAATAATASAASSSTGAGVEDYADYDFDYDDSHDVDMLVEEDDDVNRGRPLPPRSVPLIPSGCRTDSQGVRQFVDNFASRYGSTCPLFSNASLASAIDEADGESTADRKPLALYLHHDRSIAAQIFCSNVLTNPAVIEFLNANFVLWPWDLTQQDNAATLVTVAARQLGLDVADRIRQLAPHDLPALIVLAHRPRAPHEVVGDVQGVSDPSAALDMLVKALDEFRAWRQAELAEENAREMRTMERLEIQSAYEESLRLDRQKEEQRAEKLRLEREQQERAEAELRKALAQLPEEPQPGQRAATIRLRLPGGSETRQRRFNPDDRLRHLAAYCASLGYAESAYNLVTAFPRRLLSQLDRETTLEAAGLVPQETVLLEEK